MPRSPVHEDDAPAPPGELAEHPRDGGELRKSVAERLDGGAALAHARSLLDSGGGAVAQRRVVAQRGIDGLVDWLAERYGSGE